MSPRIHAVQWRDDGLLAFKLAGGAVFADDAPARVNEMLKGFAVVEYRPWHRRVLYQFDDGYGFTSELGTAGRPAPIGQRPVVYLDQNQWSMISKTLFAPQRVKDPAERAAAVQLLRMAEAGKVILPLSAGHMSETVAWSHDGGRRELARTLLEGSRGWQMRDPLDVRSHEFQAMLAASAGLTPPWPKEVFTLEPYAALGSRLLDDSDPDLPAETPDSWIYGYLSVRSTNVIVSSLLTRTPIPQGNLDGWVERVQNFGTWLNAQTDRTKQQRRRSAQAFAAADVGNELVRAAIKRGVTAAQMGDWYRSSWDKATLGAPAITMFRAAMIDKFLACGKWESNDLTDLMYLCTAAGYADYVVGERRTVALLRQAVAKLGARVSLHTKLATVVESLES